LAGAQFGGAAVSESPMDLTASDKASGMTGTTVNLTMGAVAD